MKANAKPRTGRIDRGDSHSYLLDGKRVPGVTSILNAEAKPVLAPWSSKMAAEFVRDNLPEVVAAMEADPAEGVKLVSGAPRRYTKQTQDLGKRVHSLCEQVIAGEPVDRFAQADAAPFMQMFDAFVDMWKPEFLLCEAPVFSRKHQYAGTLDGIARINGDTYLFDIKTGNNVYPSVGLQLAAYRYADFFLDADGNEQKLPPMSGGLVLHLRPGSYSLIPTKCGGEQFNLFLTYRRAWEWADHLSKTVLGEPWTGPASEVPDTSEEDPW